MAYGIKSPPIAEWIINLGEAAEYMFDHNIFQDNLVGVDFCEQMVRQTNPSLWEKAQNTPAPHADDHGYRTIGDIMTALNPFTGAFYRETLLVSRYTREMFSLMEGRHVHPSTLYPGGVGTVPLDAWERIVASNPELADLQPDVEALLVNRLDGAREYYRVSIDRCFALVGLMRTRWHGFSGGPDAWAAIREFFDGLRSPAEPARE